MCRLQVRVNPENSYFHVIFMFLNSVRSVIAPRLRAYTQRMQSNTFYITTAINYTNGSPHFGHAYEAIAADVLARYHRLLGDEVYFTTGTDEHGQKVAETAAVKRMHLEVQRTHTTDLTPIELCDMYVAEFQGLNNRLNISNDFYIRTTLPEHADTSQWLWRKATENGDIYHGAYEG